MSDFATQKSKDYSNEKPFFVTITLAAVIFMLMSVPAAGQSVCAFRDKALEHLAEKYQETPVAAGIANSGALVEVLTTDDGGTWSIIVTRPDGWACLVAAGEGWRKIDKPTPEGTVL